MNKLVFADIPRVLRSKILYGILAFAAFTGIASVITALWEANDKTLLFSAASNSLVFFLSILLPVFSGGLSVLLIANEFSSGIIRNKLIMGHKRSQILFAWGFIYSLFTILTFILFSGVFFVTLLVVGTDFTGVDFGIVSINLLIILMFALKFQTLSFLMVCIYPDEKTAAITFLLNSLTIVPLMLVSLADKQSGIERFLSRIILFGYTSNDFTLTTAPNKPWLTILLIAVLSIVYMCLALILFKRKEIK